VARSPRRVDAANRSGLLELLDEATDGAGRSAGPAPNSSWATGTASTRCRIVRLTATATAPVARRSAALSSLVPGLRRRRENTMPDSTATASRTMMAIGSVQALLCLGLPFALEAGSSPTANIEKLFGGTEVWSGWSLARASRIDGHVPIPAAWATVLVVATVGLVVLAWLALERPWTWLSAAVCAVGSGLLVSSILIGNAVRGSFGDGHEGTSGWGLAVWRAALLLVVVAAGRAVLRAEANAAAVRRS
jgi:hypothetical protein